MTPGLRTPRALVVGLGLLMASCSAADGPPAAAPASTTTTTTTEAAVAASMVTRVPDPRPGDLREDETADLLPESYTAAAPASTLTDVAYGDHPEHKLDLHLPDDGFAPVILFHPRRRLGSRNTDSPQRCRT